MIYNSIYTVILERIDVIEKKKKHESKLQTLIERYEYFSIIQSNDYKS